MGNPIFQKGSPTPLFTVKKEVFSWLRDGSKTIDVRKGTPRRGSIAFFQSGKNHLRQHIVKTETGALTDVIRKFTVKIGVAEGAEAIALLAVNPSSPTQEVSKRIQQIHNVETVYEVTGEYDIIAVIGGMNVVEVNECIEKIRRVEGIMKTNTMIVLRSW